MKIASTLGLILTPLFAATLLNAQDSKSSPQMPQTTQPPAQAASAFTDEQKIQEVGWIIAKRSSLTELQFSPSEIQAIIHGFTLAMNGKEAPFELEKIGPELDQLMQKRQAAYLAAAKAKSTALASAFFDKLKENKNIVTLPSGLRYEVVQAGTGAFPAATDTVKVNYTGTLVDGTVFDSSLKSGQPVEFPLTQVIPAWTEGIQKINKGGKIKLYAPASLAYGDEGRPNIPPGSTLVFDVELIDFKPTPAAPVAPAAPAAPTP
jgi:FKBP-type peptidyl-prolyl cis-trans isomerase